MRMSGKILFCLLLCAGCFMTVKSPDVGRFEEGLATFNQGNYRTAYREFLLLAKRGDARAQTRLGFMYDEGRGIPKDYAEAIRWYRKAAEQGDAEAQNNLGFMYKNGRGIPRDDVKAYKWFSLSAAQGHKIAANFLDFIERQMTWEQIAEAQEEARAWLEEKREDG